MAYTTGARRPVCPEYVLVPRYRFHSRLDLHRGGSLALVTIRPNIQFTVNIGALRLEYTDIYLYLYLIMLDQRTACSTETIVQPTATIT